MLGPEGDREVLLRALDVFGRDAQLSMVAEEIGELLTAVFQARRGRVGPEVIVDELADVSVVMDSVALMFGITREQILERRAFKVRRLDERVASAADVVLVQGSTMSVQNPILVFGCFWRRYGHHLGDRPSSPGATSLTSVELRHLERWLDNIGDRARDERGERLPQPEGAAVVRRCPGWTAIDWWDRQGDERFGSHTSVLCRGDVNPEVLLARARAEVPWAFRVEVSLEINKEGGS